MKSSVVILHSVLEITVATAAAKLGDLNAAGILHPGETGIKWHFLTKGKVGTVTTMDSRIKVAIRIALLAETYGVS